MSTMIQHVPPSRRARSARLLLALAGGALLSGCMVGPNYLGPPTAAPLALQAGRFHRADVAPVNTAPPPSAWWLALSDPELTRLIDDAFAASPDLKAAEARVRNARASLKEDRTKLLPQGGATALYAHAKLPGSIDKIGQALGSSTATGTTGTTTGASAATTSIPSSLDLYSVGMDASWEIDLFGGVRRGIEGAKATAQAQQATYEDAQVRLAAEVAQAYVNLRDSQHRLALGKSASELQGRMLALTLQRRAGGTASDADVERLRTQLSQTRADLVPLAAQLDQYTDQLAVLTGREPGTLDAELATPGPLPLPPATTAIGDPASFLRRRPDIRQAERQLAASNAAIGQNVASYFPTVTLFGTLGFGSTDAGKLFSSDNFNALGAPSLSWNILNFPRINAQVREAKATRDAAEASYQQAVLAALQDAEDSLSRYGHQRQNVMELTQAEASAARAAKLTQQRFAGGTVSLIDSLDAERQRVSTEQSLAQAQAMLTNDYVALQKSLGLGWAAPTGAGNTPATARAAR